MSILAWRYWWWSDDARYLDLVGTMGHSWPVQQTFVAQCYQYVILSDSNKYLPHTECYCGIYALKEPAGFYERPNDAILGVVEIWGKIIIAEYGYRAQYAQIRALVNAPARACETYRIPNLPSVEYARKEFFS